MFLVGRIVMPTGRKVAVVYLLDERFICISSDETFIGMIQVGREFRPCGINKTRLSLV